MSESLDVRQSVVNLRALLYAIIDSPELYSKNRDLYDALVSQASMVAYTSEEYQLVGCSLNTFKRVASSTVSEGFNGINSLRIESYNLLSSFKTKTRVKKGSRRNLESDLKKLNRKLEVRELEIVTLIVVCEDLRALAKKLAMTELPNREKLWLKEMSVIDAKLLSIGR
jgi:hypothetical protein